MNFAKAPVTPGAFFWRIAETSSAWLVSFSKIAPRERLNRYELANGNKTKKDHRRDYLGGADRRRLVLVHERRAKRRSATSWSADHGHPRQPSKNSSPSQGKLEAKQYVDVGTQVSGQLKAIHVDIGDTVTKGQLLAEIDPRVYQAQVEAGEAKLNSLRAQLNQQKAEAVLAEQNLKRNQNLIAVNAVSQQALQETESQAAVAKAQVDSIIAQIQETESNLKASRTNLSYTKIYAPMAGTVTTLPTKEGQTLNANQTAPTVLQVANLDLMTVRAQVAEADVSRLKENMPAYFTTLGNSERRWTGQGAPGAADAADRQRRGALRCPDRREKRRPTSS